jgi:hypothetical protein
MSKQHTRIGLRAITMQQPFAAAMVCGMGKFTRRGKCVDFGPSGEWIAIHCGANDTHLKNAKLMKEVRAHWPDCPSDADLKASQKHLIGVSHFIDGAVDSSGEEAGSCFFVKHYPACSKKFAWRADYTVPSKVPVAYPKGQVQIWHIYKEGFPNKGAEDEIHKLVPKPAIKENDSSGNSCKTTLSKRRYMGEQSSCHPKKIIKHEVQVKKEN